MDVSFWARNLPGSRQRLGRDGSDWSSLTAEALTGTEVALRAVKQQDAIAAWHLVENVVCIIHPLSEATGQDCLQAWHASNRAACLHSTSNTDLQTVTSQKHVRGVIHCKSPRFNVCKGSNRLISDTQGGSFGSAALIDLQQQQWQS